MSLVDYSDLENEIMDAPEPSILEAGTEVKVRIINVRSGVSDKNNCKWYSPVYEVPDDPMVVEFNDFFWDLDRTKLDSKAFQRSLHKFKTFAKAFEVDLSVPFSWEDDLVGKEGWLITGVKKDDTFGNQNTVRKYVEGVPF